jgi:hypothetical protein
MGGEKIRARFLAAMKIAAVAIENKGLISNKAIFMHGGEPKDHDIFARNDRLEGVSACC